MRIRPYRTLENVIEGAVITFTDISLIKQAQVALRDSEVHRRLAVMVRDARDAILVQDLTGRILAWNPAAERMYGWSEAEALTMNIRDLMPANDREPALKALREQCQSGTLEPLRIQRITKNGPAVPVSLIVSALVSDAGEMYAIATTERSALPELKWMTGVLRHLVFQDAPGVSTLRPVVCRRTCKLWLVCAKGVGRRGLQ